MEKGSNPHTPKRRGRLPFEMALSGPCAIRLHHLISTPPGDQHMGAREMRYDGGDPGGDGDDDPSRSR